MASIHQQLASISNFVLPLWHRLKSNSSKLVRIGFLKEARTRILLWYVLLLLSFIATTVPTIRNRLYWRVNERVKEDMREAIDDFEEVLVEGLLDLDLEDPQMIKGSEIDKSQKLYKVFDAFFSNTITADDNYLIGIVDGQFYKSSSRSLPTVIEPGSELMRQWEGAVEEVRGEAKVPDPEIGSILYKVIPIKTTEEIIGVFVVTHATQGEQQEAVEAYDLMLDVVLLILPLALFLAWFAAGRVLAPLRELAGTARSINESDLSQRIDVKGDGELAELGQAFNQMMNRIETSFATQRNFINDAGHELRTPITIVRGHLELMELDEDPAAQQETVALVIDELDRMNRLVEDLILLAKAERPDFLQSEIIDLNSFTAELFSKVQALGDRHWILTHVALGQFVGDRQRLTQAIINLANNAVQHTNPQDTITLGSQVTQHQLRIWIADSGEGIALPEQKRIFERFARVKNTPRRSEGSGLGLSIVKVIVEAHGGKINLQSSLGCGATFTLILPLKLAAHRK